MPGSAVYIKPGDRRYSASIGRFSGNTRAAETERLATRRSGEREPDNTN